MTAGAWSVPTSPEGKQAEAMLIAVSAFNAWWEKLDRPRPDHSGIYTSSDHLYVINRHPSQAGNRTDWIKFETLEHEIFNAGYTTWRSIVARNIRQLRSKQIIPIKSGEIRHKLANPITINWDSDHTQVLDPAQIQEIINSINSLASFRALNGQ